MSKRPSGPRTGNSYGRQTTGQRFNEGTWLEPEEWAYPHGSLRRSQRKALARDDSGRFVSAVAGIPDTYSTIPARAKAHTASGVRTRHGYLSIDNEGVLRFRSQRAARRKYEARERMRERRSGARWRYINTIYAREGRSEDVYRQLMNMTVAQLRERARKHTQTRRRR